MFNDTDSFYFSWSGDLTNSVQRQQKQKQEYGRQHEQSSSASTDIRLVPLWKRVDDRFFWNKFMLKSLIETFDVTTPTNQGNPNTAEEDLSAYSHSWVLPIIQGFVQIEKCYFDLNETSPVGSATKQFSTEGPDNVPLHKPNSQTNLSAMLNGRDYYLMTIISRRSRFRAGTRYKKRGVDENGRCANYVETEQIFAYGTHTVSFVCVRGSVPLFWSQLGNKYRPPPRLERTDSENRKAFRAHFEEEWRTYGNNLVSVNLIEHTGREKILNDAFMEHVIKLNDERLTFVTFDFHDYW